MKINSKNETVFTKTEIKKIMQFRNFVSDKIWDTILDNGVECSDMGEFFNELNNMLDRVFNYTPDTDEYFELLDQVDEEVNG